MLEISYLTFLEEINNMIDYDIPAEQKDLSLVQDYQNTNANLNITPEQMAQQNNNNIIQPLQTGGMRMENNG